MNFCGPIVGRWPDGRPMQAGPLSDSDVAKMQAQAEAMPVVIPRMLSNQWGLSISEVKQVLSLPPRHPVLAGVRLKDILRKGT